MSISNWKAWICLGLIALAIPAHAQSVLSRLENGDPLIIAHREASIPFSYVDNGKPIGYAMDICQRIVEAVRKKTGLREMPVQYLQVTPVNRIEVIKSGKADLECGSTTANAERRKDVDFAIAHFIAGARILVSAQSKVQRLEDLEGKKVVSSKGTTPLKAIADTNRARNLRMTIIEAPDHNAALDMVLKGQAEAFVMVDILLYGLIANSANPEALKVEGRFLTTEPLAIMLPKGDVAFKKVVDDEIRRLISSREIFSIYDKWFNKPIPPAQRVLHLPASYLLKDFWKYPTDRFVD